MIFCSSDCEGGNSRTILFSQTTELVTLQSDEDLLESYSINSTSSLVTLTQSLFLRDDNISLEEAFGRLELINFKTACKTYSTIKLTEQQFILEFHSSSSSAGYTNS